MEFEEEDNKTQKILEGKNDPVSNCLRELILKNRSLIKVIVPALEATKAWRRYK